MSNVGQVFNMTGVGADPASAAAAAVQAHQKAGDAHAALFEAKADRTLSNLTNPQTAIYNLGAGVRPNLLINGNFRVNQRKKTVYNSAGITVDGWCITADTVTVHVTQTGISFQNTNGAGDSYFFQKIPVSEIDLSKPYTASVLFQSGSPTKYVEFVCYHPGDIGYTVFAGNSPPSPSPRPPAPQAWNFVLALADMA